MIKSITSVSNPLIKDILLLIEKPKARKQSNTFAVEGQREILMAIKGGFKPIKILFNPNIVTYKELLDLYGDILSTIEIIEVSDIVYNKIAYRENTEGIIALFKMRDISMENFNIGKENPLILIAEAPEKPGNIGALLRTADAVGVDLFILANPKTDIYNPNIIRSSVGCIFTIPIVVGNNSEIISILKTSNIHIFCAALSEESISCYTQSYKGPTAIVVGTESIGLSEEWLASSHTNIIIPMLGQIDSLNVSVSAAIILFEAARQRRGW